jgi:hypothetical protein
MSGQLHAPTNLPPGTHWIYCLDPRADVDKVENRKFLTPPGLELQPNGRPASNQSLHRLSYLGFSPSYVYVIFPSTLVVILQLAFGLLSKQTNQLTEFLINKGVCQLSALLLVSTYSVARSKSARCKDVRIHFQFHYWY